MQFLDYQQVETLANCGIFWILKNLDFLLKQHFAGDKTAAGYIELLYVRNGGGGMNDIEMKLKQLHLVETEYDAVETNLKSELEAEYLRLMDHDLYHHFKMIQADSSRL